MRLSLIKYLNLYKNCFYDKKELSKNFFQKTFPEQMFTEGLPAKMQRQRIIKIIRKSILNKTDFLGKILAGGVEILEKIS